MGRIKEELPCVLWGILYGLVILALANVYQIIVHARQMPLPELLNRAAICFGVLSGIYVVGIILCLLTIYPLHFLLFVIRYPFLKPDQRRRLSWRNLWLEG